MNISYTLSAIADEKCALSTTVWRQIIQLTDDLLLRREPHL